MKNKLIKGLSVYGICFSINFFLWKCSGNKTYTGFNNFGYTLTWHDTISKIPTIAVISLILSLAYFYIEKHMEK